MKKGLYLNISPLRVSKQRENNFIAAIGVSSMGFQSLETFLKHLPAEKNLALVIVQHVNHGKALDADMLQPLTHLNVVMAADKTEILPGHMYILPHDRHCWFFKGKIHFFEINHARGYFPIDIFLRSMADQQKRCAAAVLLGGDTSDGISGLKYLVGHQGMGLVEQTTEKLPVYFEKANASTLPLLLVRRLKFSSRPLGLFATKEGSPSAVKIILTRGEEMLGLKINHSFQIQHS
jgi:hypothetical protein